MDLFSARQQVLTVSELLRQVRSGLESRYGLVRVLGEISDWKVATSGHAYFVLQDAVARLEAVIFRPALGRLTMQPGDGLEVECLGRLTVYEPRGRMQLVAEWLTPRGAGLQALQWQRLKEKLQAEGLFDPARKRPLPFLPTGIGVVTSLTGAALRDILQVLARRMPAVAVVISPCLVQGEEAPPSIVKALELLQRHGGCQVIIVGRGGGSAEELAAFNDEAVVRAVAGCRIPVVSAVGHEVDLVLCDLAADLRAPTPSAAAELVVPEREELVRRLLLLERLASGALYERLHNLRRRLAAGRERLRDPRLLLAAYRLRLDENVRAASESLVHHLSDWRRRLDEGRGLLQGIDPRAVLRRGYAVVSDQGGITIRDAAQVRVGQPIEVQLWRGRLRGNVTERWPVGRKG